MKYLLNYKLFESGSDEIIQDLKDIWINIKDIIGNGLDIINYESNKKDHLYHHIEIVLRIPNDGIKGHGNSLDFIKDHYLYQDILSDHEMSLNMINALKYKIDIESYYNKNTMNIRITYFFKEVPWESEEKYSGDTEFIGKEFEMVNNNYIYKKLDKLGLIIMTNCPNPFGEKHPDNRDKHRFFTLAKEIYIFDDNWGYISELHINERYSVLEMIKNETDGIRLPHHTDDPDDIQVWIITEYTKMLQELSINDPSIQRKSHIYAHDLILRLYSNQDEFRGSIPINRGTMNKYETLI